MQTSRTKIIATLGPASRNPQILSKMIMAGLDSVRINCSHTSHEQMKKDIKMVREISYKLDRDIAIIADLQGPKIRVNKLENDEIKLTKDDIITFTTENILGKDKIIPVDYEDFAFDIEPGDEILLDDGKIKLITIETDKKDLLRHKLYLAVF